MPIESPLDPRAALVRTKYFSLHPKPLERWLWRQGLAPAAERVFWLHWEAGMRNGDWCSELPLKHVAIECSVNLSTVTRAYQLLKAKGLIRREDPGRDPNNPFCQATAVTEVRLPREFLCELSRSPNRPEPRFQRSTDAPSTELPRAPEAVEAPRQGNTPEIQETPSPARTGRLSREELRALWERASVDERARYYEASRDRLTSFRFDPATNLTPEDRGYLLAELAQLAAARPASRAHINRMPPVMPAGPRRLSILELARVRRQVCERVPGIEAPEILRQVMWAVEEGALRRFDLRLALNIALKKIREGAWSRPHRMPPNWHPRSAPLKPAAPEQCSAA